MQPKINNEPDLIIASFVPLLLRKQFGFDPSRVPTSELYGDQAVLLWIDICAFSPLSNRLLLDNTKGVEHLSRILKHHYDYVLNAIVEFGGQPMVFAGDGVFTAWPCSKDELKKQVLPAIACAQSILKNNGAVDDFGNPLLLHVIVACGRCQLLELEGSDGRWLFTFLGESLDDLRLTCKNRNPGDILLSSNTLSVLQNQLNYIPVGFDSAILDEKINHLPLLQEPEEFLMPKAIKALKSYIPRTLSYKLDFDRLRWVDELRPVTVVFAQLHSSDPDNFVGSEQLQNAIKIISPIVLKYDGILNQVWIDEKAANILIVFGPPPAAHKDNPIRGLQTAVEIKEALSDASFTNSVGVSSGKAFCGILGNNHLRQYTVIGDVVNLGARLAQLQLSRVCCDEITMKGSRGEFNFTKPKLVIIKGHVEKEKIWEVLAGSKNENIETPRISIIGRRKELSLLQTCFSLALQGERVSLVLEGDSGLGKSKLLSDFSQRVNTSGNIVLKGVGEALERGIPYFPWFSIFYSLTGVDPHAHHQVQQTQLFAFLKEEFSDLASLLNAVFALDIPDSDLVRSFSVQQRAGETKNLLLNLICRASQKQPLIIIIDDAHLMDEASWSLAAEVAAKAAGCFLLFTVSGTARNKEIQLLKDAGAIYYELKGLSEKEQEKLICTTIGVQQVPKEIINTLVFFSKGNPFFCFELIQTLISAEAIVVKDGECELAKGTFLDKFPLPETIQGMVSRRIDSLDQGPKLALKVASVSGLRFETRLVQKIFPIPGEKTLVPNFLVKDNMAGLIQHEIIDGFQGYVFKNGIIRDVAYEMLLVEQKQRLHYEIAEWYEQNFGKNLTPFYARLAHHWEKAGELLKAVNYLEKQSVRLFSNGFAKQSVEIGLRGAELLDVKLERNPEYIGSKIAENMGTIAMLMADRKPSDLSNLKQLKDPKVERAIMLILRIGPFAFQSQQIELFALISVTCLRMTLEQGSGKAVAEVYSMYSIVYKGITNDRKGAYSWSELALKLDSENNNTLFSTVGFVHTWFHNHWVNHFSTSLPLALSAAKSGFASGDVLFACFNLSGYVVYLTACGRPLQEVIDFARKHLILNNKKVMNAAFHLILERQYAKALAGETINALSLTDAEYNEDKDIASICKTELGNQIGYYLVARLKLHNHQGDWRGALKWAEKAKPLLKAIEGQIAEIDLVQHIGIASLTGLLKGDILESAQLNEKAAVSLETMRNWADICPVNFEHKALLLEAFAEGVNGDYDKTENLFEKAEVLAMENDFMQDIAQLHECRLLLQHHNNKELTALEPALTAYKKWGAYGKVAYLKKLYSKV